MKCQIKNVINTGFSDYEDLRAKRAIKKSFKNYMDEIRLSEALDYNDAVDEIEDEIEPC
jgi:heme oxygenase